MSSKKTADSAAAPNGVVVADQQEEPQQGGSYTRTPETGAISRTSVPSADQPVQE
ncbi:hypothetical protein ACEN9F_13390 [Duganella sp. CT11-25]|uniref:hypothetical protein n=1 Tax=unclassified Duganella TaxID=2636909 RepID=UPI0039AFBF67